MNREFQKGELVLLLNPERDGFTPVIYIKDLEFEPDPSMHEVLDPETGSILVVNSRRIAKMNEDT